MTLATLRALAVAEQMPDWWIAHLDAYREKYPKRTAAQYFGGLDNQKQGFLALRYLLVWPRGYFSDSSLQLRYEILGTNLAASATTAQLSAALSRAFGED